LTGAPEPPKASEPEAPVTKEKVYEALKTVVDWEISQSLVDLGLIYGVDVSADGKAITIRMTLTTPYCPYGPQMVEQVRQAAAKLPGVGSVDVQLVWDPPWNPKTMASDAVKDILGLW